MDTWHLARGFRYAGVPCGIRGDSDRRDLALVVSDRPATAAGVFTRNRVVAAPVQLCRGRLPAADIRGIVICSGNANACTGARGMADAERMVAVAAHQLGVRADRMLVCSTGVIGRHLPMDRVEAGIARAVHDLGPDGTALDRAAHAILTTDTRIKVRTRRLEVDGNVVNLTGFAKGAAMIGPNMATMLAFVLTDAALDPDDLARFAPRAADQSFNSISVEGHTSTNDSLIFLANGDGPPLRGAALARWQEEALEVCVELAKAIAGDAEGAVHFVTIEVEGLRGDGEARRVAQAVANSALVKTAIYGADPNWGRIVSAAGYADVDFVEGDLSLWLGGTLLYERGTPADFDVAAVSDYMRKNRDIPIRLVFALGSGRCTFYTCDLTDEYVRLNADYTT